MATAQGMPEVDYQYFALKGGLDQVSPALSLAPGVCRDAINFECNVMGGYSRISGYERYDGRSSPSNASYWVIRCAVGDSLSVGDTIQGAVSGATAVVALVDRTAEANPTNPAVDVVITKLVSSFLGEDLRVNGNTKATSIAGEQRSGALTSKLDVQYQKAAADIYRKDIQAVPGAGAVLGVWMYNDKIYAFRNKTDNTQTLMYVATVTGWQLVPTPLLAPGGKYEFVNANFGGSAAMLKMYGCDGRNKAFQFDGTNFLQITTGMLLDTPAHIEFHRNYLFLSFDASLQHSSIGDPFTWSVVTGAAEIALGETITSIKSYVGSAAQTGTTMATETLLIHTNSKTKVLYGSSNTDFALGKQSDTAGGIASSVQILDQPYYMSDLGIVDMTTSGNFGNFESASLSQAINPYILQERSRVSASCIVRGKSQYRLYFNDGYALHVTTINGKVVGLMPINLAVAMSCMCSLKDSFNNELIFGGGVDGVVYQMERGPNFDGQAIIAYLYLAFASFKSPRTLKRWRKAVVEAKGQGYMEYAVSADLSWASTDITPSPGSTVLAQLNGAIWDQFVWDQFFWDGVSEGPSEVELDGTGENIGLKIYSEGDCFMPFNMASLIFHFSMRRKLR